MASVARRTLANVNSSAMIARHPDVPNLILVIRRSYQQDDGQTYRLCHMRVERAGRADCPDRSHRKTRCLRKRPAGCSILLCLGAAADVVRRGVAADQDHAGTVGAAREPVEGASQLLVSRDR